MDQTGKDRHALIVDGALPVNEASTYALTKRIVDLVLAILSLVVLSPVLLGVALILRFTNEREVFFRQPRIGQGNKPFLVWKFVTMRKGSEKHGTITAKDDPRVFPFGRMLRKTKINELPQLLNVVQGEMSIVGPRPQTEECFGYFPEEVQRRAFLCKPGLTGIGSVVFRDEEEILARSQGGHAESYSRVMSFKGELELWYLENRSTLVDLKIILLTAITVAWPYPNLASRWFKNLPEPGRVS
jgi:lipopolysaccharide/colanic/teichoic acid biosynthesis glycosyltransferase